MAKFIEVKAENGTLLMVNVNSIQTVEVVEGKPNQCLIQFLSGSMEDLTINENYSTLKKWIEPASHIVD